MKTAWNRTGKNTKGDEWERYQEGQGAQNGGFCSLNLRVQVRWPSHSDANEKVSNAQRVEYVPLEETGSEKEARESASLVVGPKRTKEGERGKTASARTGKLDR